MNVSSLLEIKELVLKACELQLYRTQFDDTNDLKLRFAFFQLQVKHCLELGISADSASRLFIFIGLASSLARVVTGRLCDASRVNAMYVHQFGDLLVGIATIVLPLLKSYTGFLLFAVVYGVGDGIFITTMNSLLLFTVDEKRRAAALGIGSNIISLVFETKGWRLRKRRACNRVGSLPRRRSFGLSSNHRVGDVVPVSVVWPCFWNGRICSLLLRLILKCRIAICTHRPGSLAPTQCCKRI